MKSHPPTIRTALFLLTTGLLLSHAVQRTCAAATQPDLSKEAEAARMGSSLNWDIDAIRNALEENSRKTTYTKASKGAVAGIPTSDQLKEKTVDDLFEMCRHLNPAIRSIAGREIATRGSEAYEYVAKNAASPEPAVRAACAEALVNMINSAASADKDSDDWHFFTEHFAQTCSLVTSLIQDSHVLVRRSAMQALNGSSRIVRKLPPEAKQVLNTLLQSAMLQASTESDEHICQQILISFNGNKWEQLLDTSTRADLLAKALLQQPFPRGRGAAMNMISRLPDEETKAILPHILTAFRTPCLRDSMFFPGGRPEAFALLMKHREAAPAIFNDALQHASELNMEPWVSFTGRHSKAMKIFWSALGALGPEAATVLPSLELLQRRAEEELAEQQDKTSWRYDRAKEAVDYGNAIIEGIRK